MFHSSADAKVVHFAFAAGEELSEHTASRPATVQIISGRFELTLAGERVDAGPGVWVYMERGLPHALRRRPSPSPVPRGAPRRSSATAVRPARTGRLHHSSALPAGGAGRTIDWLTKFSGGERHRGAWRWGPVGRLRRRGCVRASSRARDRARSAGARSPRLRPFLDRARRCLRDVGVEAGLDAALADFRPILDVLARWPCPRDPSTRGADLAPTDRRALSWSDRRVLRFCAAFSALWALCHGPEDECGQLFARTAVELGRRGGLAESRSRRVEFMRDSTIINGMSFVRHSPAPSDEGSATSPGTDDAPGVLDALAPARRRREDALARPSARRIERALRAAPRGLTAQQVAEAVGRHHTGVRAQLAELERSGVVEVRVDLPAGRGRPPRRYLLAPDPTEREAAGHRELVRLLMSLVREAGFGPAEIERFGERQGAGIVRSGGGVGEIWDVFARLGFAPRRGDDGPPGDLVLGRCPFTDGVEAPNGQLICLLHRGLARGIARAAAPGTEVIDLEVREPRRAGCRLRLSSLAPGRDDGA